MTLRPFALCVAVALAVAGQSPRVMAQADAAMQHAAPAPEAPLVWLDAREFAPERLLAAPPADGSIEQQAEMATVRALQSTTPPARRALAAADGEDETPRAFAGVLGRDPATLPATAHLLDEVTGETERLADRAKRWFHRHRPYAVDPTLDWCGKATAKPHTKGAERSYPSGHSTFGWTTASVLAALLPDRAPAILARAEEYGYSREICAVHYPSDIEAGHVLGVTAARALLADPRLAADIAAARAELAALPAAR